MRGSGLLLLDGGFICNPSSESFGRSRPTLAHGFLVRHSKLMASLLRLTVAMCLTRPFQKIVRWWHEL